MSAGYTVPGIPGVQRLWAQRFLLGVLMPEARG